MIIGNSEFYNAAVTQSKHLRCSITMRSSATAARFFPSSSFTLPSRVLNSYLIKGLKGNSVNFLLRLIILQWCNISGSMFTGIY